LDTGYSILDVAAQPYGVDWAMAGYLPDIWLPASAKRYAETSRLGGDDI